ncbi:hypothetical protein H072_9095 [Dactylellina haptotyla CBS 200.50]|uniref:Uncharacterized protein n=1 Tax=Dactylellina haptotyla (strain CBS 200.50) TaxID=1284197 RepID=S8A2T2_DACHA|nr:hypothetical protein H072_9095 [Dactylellina haptotyla CBS 200.50]
MSNPSTIPAESSVATGEYQLTRMEAELKRGIEEALVQRKVQYKIRMAVSIYFEDDSTGGAEDSDIFIETATSSLNILPAFTVQIKIPKGEPAELFWQTEILSNIASIERVGRKRNEDTLILFHYAGHASSEGRKLSFSPQGESVDASLMLNWGTIVSSFALFSPKTDIACIIDCCGSGLVINHDYAPVPKTGLRTLEVLTSAKPDEKVFRRPEGELLRSLDEFYTEIEKRSGAQGSSTPSQAEFKRHRSSFTSKVCSQFRQLQQEEETINLGEVWERINQFKLVSDTSPMHNKVWGKARIIISRPVKKEKLKPLQERIEPKEGQASGSLPPVRRSRIMLRLMFPGEYTTDKIREICDWFRLMPDYCETDVEFVGETNSSLIILTILPAYELLIHKLAERHGATVENICNHVFGRNMAHSIVSSWGRVPAGENISEEPR